MSILVITADSEIQQDAFQFFTDKSQSRVFDYEIISLSAQNNHSAKVCLFSRLILMVVSMIENLRFKLCNKPKLILSRIDKNGKRTNSNSAKIRTIELRSLKDELNRKNYEFVIVFDEQITKSIFDFKSTNELNLIFIPDLGSELGRFSRGPLNSSIKRVDFTSTYMAYMNQVRSDSTILFYGRIPTQKFSTLNQKYVTGLLLDNLEKVLMRFIAGENQIHSFVRIPDYDIPSFTSILNYFLHTNLTAILNLLLRLTKRKNNWHIYISKFENNEIVFHQRLTNPCKGFLADPFLVSRNNQVFCFFEYFDGLICKGKISYVDLAAPDLIHTALEEDFHLSYPYVFQYLGDFYMIPETSEKRQIRLYKAINFPAEWELVRVLIDSIDAVDVAIYTSNGLWWMLFTTSYADLNDHSSQLNLYYSKELISGEWLANPYNPILVDGECARNAGRIGGFEHLVRPFQRQGYSSYGKSIGAAKILILEKGKYLEEEIEFQYKRILGSTQGTHHVDLLENVMAFDKYEKT